ncbi:ATP-dependent helicase [Lysinibacillus fusiformis]|uniref:ATP-dependent helicase n=1 Tax=Lysinibacillus fusiformis TaxID=28031 RepID=UPI0018E65543|nr:ATP-dependent DNA helicase [Lysinibacillus fusiformis]MBI6862769.1 ATP-dependent helicase [Lysinibacillus fusiformis]
MITNLSQYQKKAVESTEGPLLIIAGPGSGKTFTLVERILYLIQNKEVEPENIMVATFTEKAANELVTRISNKLHSENIKFNLNEMYVGTIHSICLRILEENREYTRLKKNYTLLDQFDQQYLIYQKMRRFLEIEDIGELLSTNQSRWKQSEFLLKWINKLSEEIVSIDDLLKHEDIRLNVLGKCYKVYSELLIEENALDFSTIQLETLKLLEENDDIRFAYNDVLHYLMIDEYQDTNTIQEKLVFLLAGERQNICVVGDDDQGLYRFRGATIRNILEFPSNFEEGTCEQVELSTNYRSNPAIVQFYNHWMEQNNWLYGSTNYRFDKKIEAHESNFIEQKSVIKVSGENGLGDWESEVYLFLKAMKEQGKLTDWNQVALLFKSVTNPKVLSLSRYLEERGIPVYSPRSNLYFERREVKLALGAILFLFPQYGRERKWNDDAELPEWEYYDACLREFAGELRKPENKDLLNWCKVKARDHLVLEKNTDYTFSGLFYQLIQFELFSSMISENIFTVKDSREARNLSLFSNMLTKYEYLHHISVLTPNNITDAVVRLFNQYIRFLIQGGINEYEDDSEYAPSGCVSFLTIHQSKGLEFPIVLVGSLNATPTKQYTELDEILQNEFYSKPPFEPLDRTKYYDFYRLYYTAYSRAQNILALTCQENISNGRGTRNVPAKTFVESYQHLKCWREEPSIFDIELAQVKDVNIKREYSFTSHINLFETCALQYKFYKELGFAPVRQGATIFGTLVHQTIEDIHKAVLKGEQHSITLDNITGWFNTNYQYLSKSERVYLAESTKVAALKQVEGYVEKQNGDWSRIQEAEVDVSLVKDNYILKGTIDVIKGDGDTVEIIDFKSEKKPDLEKEREAINRYKRQLEVYAHLVEERTDYKVSKMHIYYTGEQQSNPYVTFNKESSVINQTIKSFDTIVERIEKYDYTIKERPKKHCGNCDMRFYCDRNL